MENSLILCGCDYFSPNLTFTTIVLATKFILGILIFVTYILHAFHYWWKFLDSTFHY